MKGRGYNMLTEDRHSNILSLLDKEGSVTVQQLMKELQTSESTIRRDLNQLDSQGFLTKVHGGAIAKNTIYSTMDENVMNRKALNADAKIKIAKYAASLIEPGDFVYLDAGTTTELMIDYITNRQTVFVTNAISHAKKLSDIGFRVYILGGEFKSATEAIVGEEAIISLDKYNFTKGFWGANGVTKGNGFTTPDVKEAMVKKKSMQKTKERYVLCDSSKFGEICSISFAEFKSARIITTKIENNEYRGMKNITEVSV